MQPFDFQTRTRVIFGEGGIAKLGSLAGELGFRRTLLVADRGLVACGYVKEASDSLAEQGIECIEFHDFDINPDTVMIEFGTEFAATRQIDSIVGLGGGSSMDCAKGINFLLTNGGRMRDYWGIGKATKPMLPMIGIPTTSGTGSEAQSFALISDAETHAKMACGDPKASFRIAILDPLLTLTQPRAVTATAGYDAISHAVETYVTTRRTPISGSFSREAWAMLDANYERVLTHPTDVQARGAMQLGSHYAGLAIENSMLGAAHACANPLTAHYGTIHGIAIALFLPHVVRWNSEACSGLYQDLLRVSAVSNGGAGRELGPGEQLAGRLERLAEAGGLPRTLEEIGVSRGDLPMLATEASSQWTGQFNPRPVGIAECLEIYNCAF